MTKISYPSTSPYSATSQTSWFIGKYVDRPIPPANDDSTYTLKPRHQYRPTVLSNELYGTPAYWWVFMQRNINLIRDPTYDFVTGLTIIVPSSTHLKQTLGT